MVLPPFFADAEASFMATGYLPPMVTPAFVLTDGSVHFLSENIDSALLDALATRDGGEVIGEF